MCAVRWGRADCVRLLIDAGADKEAKNNVRKFTCLLPVSLTHLIFRFMRNGELL